MQIQISTDLDLHCLLRQGISRFSRTRVKTDKTVDVQSDPSFCLVHIIGDIFSPWCPRHEQKMVKSGNKTAWHRTCSQRVVNDNSGIISYPAGTWHLYNVGSTSMQRHDVASTLRRRCINVMCLLGTVLQNMGCGYSWKGNFLHTNLSCG